MYIILIRPNASYMCRHTVLSVFFSLSKVAIVVQYSKVEEEEDGKKERDFTARDYVPHVNVLCATDNRYSFT